MRNFISLSIISLITFASCVDKQSPRLSDNSNWQSGLIETDVSTFFFSKKDSTLKYIASGFHVHRNDSSKEKSWKLSHETMDSLFVISQNIIQNKIDSIPQVTCYAGNLLVQLKNKKDTIEIFYSSVGDWEPLSIETKTLSKILHEKLK